MSKKKAALFGFIMMVLGFGMASDSKPKQEVKTVTKEVQVTNPAWRDLKEVDDKGFAIAGQMMKSCSNGFYAIAESDLDKLAGETANIKRLTPQLLDLSDQRARLLNTLGY